MVPNTCIFRRVTRLRPSSFIYKEHGNLMAVNNNIAWMNGRTIIAVSSGARCSSVRCKRRDAPEFVLVW